MYKTKSYMRNLKYVHVTYISVDFKQLQKIGKNPSQSLDLGSLEQSGRS